MNNKILYSISFLLSALIIGGAWIYSVGFRSGGVVPEKNSAALLGQNVQNVDDRTVVLPVNWGDLGEKMIEAGVIDANKLEAVYQTRGGLSAEDKNLLYGKENGRLKINSSNSSYILNLLWAFGLGNKNDILENGEMTNPKYGGAGKFASTGGWTIADGNTMNHYSKHSFVVLTASQQDLVDGVSRNIYRPCCGNSTHFPDCNHGMAMLGLLELMAFQGVSESDMYKYALKVNELWFPDVYATINSYLKTLGFSLETADPKEILGPGYSSIVGFRNIANKVAPSTGSGGNGCGV